MALTELPRPPGSSRTPAADPASGAPSEFKQLHRTSKRWALVAAVLCPCHLWLVAGVLSLFGAGVTAAAIRDNQVMLAVVLVPLTVAALWRAVASGRRATELERTGLSCSTKLG